jgi:hypothetical protein
MKSRPTDSKISQLLLDGPLKGAEDGSWILSDIEKVTKDDPRKR